MKLHCEFCNKPFERTARRYNEAIKNGWHQYCSLTCQTRAKEKSVECMCTLEQCGKKFYRKLAQVLISDHLYCSKPCSAIYYAQKSHEKHLHKCNRPGCKNMAVSKDNRKKFCSPECLKHFQKMSSYTRNTVLRSIQGFYNNHDRIPLKYEMKYLYAPARRFFGTWNQAIVAAGYDPNPVMFAKHYMAKDGHKCDSLAEKIVDDYLSARKIEHEVHIPYPWNNGMKCDFLIGGTWIEIFGLEGNLKRYDQLMKEKLVMIKKYQLRLIHLSLADVYSKNGLDLKLQQLG